MSIPFLKSERLESAGFPVHGFTQKSHGVSQGAFESLNLAYNVGDEDDRVARNLSLLQRELGVQAPLARVDQVHGNKVVSASGIESNDWTVRPVRQADGIVTAEDSVIAVQTADCAAVLLADPETRVVAAIHAGWRGTAAGVIRNGVRRMDELGASSGRLIAVIGPCICEKCYEVGEEVAVRLPESADPIRKKPGKFLLDLANAIEVSLLIAGVATARVDRIPACTVCDETLFSYRRSGGTCGRMLGFISPKR